MDQRPVKYARTLAEAEPNSLVYVDRQGRVRTPARLRALTGATYGVLAGLMAALGYFSWSLGPAGIVFGGAFLAWAGNSLLAMRRVRRATRLAAAGQRDEAMGVLTTVAGGRLLPATHRALADSYLAGLLLRAGRFEEALGRADRAVAGSRRQNIHVQLARYNAIIALIGLGRLDEARRRLAGIPDQPGEMLRLMRWTVELYLAFIAGRHDLDDDTLHARARFALGLSTGTALLGLLSWAHRQLGHDDMAAHLLGEAYERDTRDLPAIMPAVYAWMEANRASA
jgi:tetratricopeptide (TPR) repeat protein